MHDTYQANDGPGATAAADSIPTGGGEGVRRWPARLYSAISGAVGTIAGIAPHVLHHIGPLAGAAVVSGAAGSALFAALGFVLTIPLLARLKRRFGSWLAPAIALTIFAAMFTISTLWIGPAIRDALSDSDDGSAPGHEQHHVDVLPDQAPRATGSAG